MLACGIYITLTAQSFGAYMLGAFLVGLFWQQASFLGHDFGHNGVFHNK